MAVGPVDRFQRRHRVLGVPIAIFYKFVDDQGNLLAAMLTYYAFVAIFPLLLLASSIFGFVLQGRPDLQEAALDSALAQFPIIGEELAKPDGLTGSVTAVVLGSLVALYGALGLGQSVQNVMNTAWGVPRNSRPNPVLMRVRSLVLLGISGFAVLTVSVGSALVNTEVVEPWVNETLRWIIVLGTVLVITVVLSSIFRLAGAQVTSFWRAAPGALFVALGWLGLQYAGTAYAQEVLARASSVNQPFALALGLIGLIFLAAVFGVLGIEVNVVLARKLWPRALLTPFTDNVDLTEADRRAYAMYAQAQRHKGFETVIVRFDGRDGDTHEIEQVPHLGDPDLRHRPAPAPLTPTPGVEDGPGA